MDKNNTPVVDKWRLIVAVLITVVTVAIVVVVLSGHWVSAYPVTNVLPILSAGSFMVMVGFKALMAMKVFYCHGLDPAAHQAMHPMPTFIVGKILSINGNYFLLAVASGLDVRGWAWLTIEMGLNFALLVSSWAAQGWFGIFVADTKTLIQLPTTRMTVANCIGVPCLAVIYAIAWYTTFRLGAVEYDTYSMAAGAVAAGLVFELTAADTWANIRLVWSGKEPKKVDIILYWSLFNVSFIQTWLGHFLRSLAMVVFNAVTQINLVVAVILWQINHCRKKYMLPTTVAKSTDSKSVDAKSTDLNTTDLNTTVV